MAKELTSQKDEKSDGGGFVLVRSIGGRPVSVLIAESYGDTVEVYGDTKNFTLPLKRSLIRTASEELAKRIKDAYSSRNEALLSVLWRQTGAFDR